MNANNRLIVSFKIFPWQRTLQEWLSVDAPVLIYMAKSTIAALLALWIAMTLNMPDPRTAIFTVFIVMQPQSGLVFSKSYYRVLGTIAGVGMSLLIMGMFAQDPIWFIGFFALWIGFTTAMGLKYRNFQFYGFVLAGYTLCIVALPVIETPLQVFDIAVSRFSEVIIGIMCATVVSDVIFPRRLLDSLITSEQERFHNVLSTLSDPDSIFAAFDEANPAVSRFSSGVVGLNATRVNSSFESGAGQKERQHYAHLNQEYMNLSTTFYSLKSIVHAIKEQERKEVINALESLYSPVVSVLKTLPDTLLTPEDLNRIIRELLTVKNTIQVQLELDHKRLYESTHSAGEDEFISAAYLIIRLVNELHNHCATYLSLLKHRLSGNASREISRVIQFSTHTDNLLVALAALRGSGVLLLTMVFWLWSGWPYATLTITLAVVIGLLLGTMPSPLDGVKDFFKGAVIALIVAAVYDFYIIPEYTSDLLTLSLLITPVLALIGWMTTRPKLAIFTFGFVFMFMNQLALDPYYKIEPTKFMESSLAALIGILFGGLAYILVNFWSCSLTQKRVAKILRTQIVRLCDGALNVERSALESTGRDLIQQFSTQGRLNMRSSRLVYEWLLSTLEIGRAILTIRRSIQRLYSHYLHPSVNSVMELIKSYFETPSVSGRDQLLSTLQKSLQELHSSPMPTEIGQRKRVEILIVELTLIRTVLINSETFPLLSEDSCN